MSTTEKKIKKKQWLIFSAVVVVVLAVAVGGAALMQPASNKKTTKLDKPTTKSLNLAGNKTDQENWRVQSSVEFQSMEDKIKMLEEQIKNRDDNEKKAVVTPPQPEGPPPDVFSTMAPPPPPPSSPPVVDSGNGNGFVLPGAGALPGKEGSVNAGRIKSITVDQSVGEENEAGQNNKNINNSRVLGERVQRRGPNGERYADDNPLSFNRAGGRGASTYIPPGTFMRVVLLNGLDAPTGGQAQQNPNPVLMRVIDNAQLPNNFRAALKNCVLTGAGSGDLSAERAYIRLDRIACIEKGGAAIDVAVKGYISGEDGKTGVRGRLITKTGQVLANAIFAGVISGFGEALRQSSVSTTTAPGTGAMTQDVSNTLEFGIGAGVGKGMDRVVQYYMKLADKIFPVIEIDGGRIVDVVITQGFTIERTGNK